MLRHPALLCGLHLRFKSVQVSFIFLHVHVYGYYHNQISMFIYTLFFVCREAEDPAHCMGGVLSLYHPTATATPHQHTGGRTEGPATDQGHPRGNVPKRTSSNAKGQRCQQGCQRGCIQIPKYVLMITRSYKLLVLCLRRIFL